MSQDPHMTNDAPPQATDDAVKPGFFQMRSQLLDAGNTEMPLAVGEHLWLKIKVYAKGGENKLHAHPYQDHSFIVLSGRACFHGPQDETRELGPNDGIFLPKNCFYWFETISDEPLVLLRVGATMANTPIPVLCRTANGRFGADARKPSSHPMLNTGMVNFTARDSAR
jgi:mannose-6-phosphate isomerase-like protein (cupin superfamily)